MSTSTVTAPPSERTTPGTQRTENRTDEPSLHARYVGAMLYFVGAALIAGAVVHYPIAPPLYSVICAVGALVFLLGTVVNEFIFAAERPALRRAISLVTFSLLLSFGVGLLGGGIQHFTQFPERSAVMTPIGLVMSYVAFVAKDPQGRVRNLLSLFGASVVALAVLTWFGMTAIADSMDVTDHHGTGQSPSGHTPPDRAPAEEGDAPSSGQQAPTQEHQGSHSH